MSEKMVKVRDLMSPEFVARWDAKFAASNQRDVSIDVNAFIECSAAAEDHSERMTPLDDGMEHFL